MINQTTRLESTAVPAIVIFDIDGVVRDVSQSYRRALADTVEQFTKGAYRPTSTDIDQLKSEGLWNNDWLASQELIHRYWETQGQSREQTGLNEQSVIDFFQSRYLGSQAETWTGYICDEPLLVQPEYFAALHQAKIPWGFFSGAPRAEAAYVLKRLGIDQPVLVAMEDAPDKPNPIGLFAAIQQIEQQYHLDSTIPVVYAGDTVADIYTINQAIQQYPQRTWRAVGILPPHVQTVPVRQNAYQETLKKAGAAVVLSNITELSAEKIQQLLK